MTVTNISNDFIDKYLAQANGEFLKVYIFMLRHENENISTENIADALDMTEKDVLRAIKYWDERGLLKENTPEKDVDLIKLNGDDEFKALLLGLQNYMGKTFSSADAETVGYMYETLQMPVELIEHLFMVCRQKGKTSLRYIEKVALNWYEKGINSVEKANKDTAIFSSEISTVMKNFGISGRDLTPKEKEYVDRWYKEWHMTHEQVEEACAKTILATGKPRFPYAESILRKIHEGTNEVDSDNTKKRAMTAESNSNATAKAHNFNERKNDLDSDILDKFNDLIK